MSKLAYTDELADFGYVLNNLEGEVGRLERALDGLERAVRASSDSPDYAVSELANDAQRLEVAARNTREHYSRLAALIELLERQRASHTSGMDAATATDQARRVFDEVSADMEHLWSIWRSLSERARLALLQTEVRQDGARWTRWFEDWPLDADLAEQLSQRILEPRDKVLVTAYYGQRSSQTAVAEAIGVSQPTVAARLTTLRGVISAAIGLKRFAERFPATPETARDAEFDRPTASQFHVPVALLGGEQRTILLLPSDRLQKRPPLGLESRRAGPITDIAVYLVSQGKFRFRRLPVPAPLSSINVKAEQPYANDEAIQKAFPIEEDTWKQ